MKNRKRYFKRNKSLLFIILIICISVGYAILTSNLKINGNSMVKSASWNIHWDNIVVNSGSVTGDNVVKKATIVDSKKTIVEFSVILAEPGDFYEFTLDAVNEGTLDAKVKYISNSPLTDEQKEYMEYKVTYLDGSSVDVKDALKAGTSEKMKVLVKYRDDIDPSKLPEESETVTTEFEIEYDQDDGTAIVIGECNEDIYENGEINESNYLKRCSKYINENLYTYSNNDDGTITITGFDENALTNMKNNIEQVSPSKMVYNRSESSLVKMDNETSNLTFKDKIWAIPSSINGKHVTKIAGAAFYNRNIDAILVLSPFMTEITYEGHGAFDTNKITKIALPHSLVKIGATTFQNNMINELKFRDVKYEFGQAVFYNNQLKEVELPKKNDTIVDNLFNTNKIEKLTIPENIKTIGSAAFFNNQIKELVIPDNVTQLNGGAFWNNPIEYLKIGKGIQELNLGIPNSLSTLKKVDLNCKKVFDGFFYQTSNLEEVILRENVEEIGSGAFNLSGVKNITLSEGLKKIGPGAFNRTSNLSTIDLPSTVEIIDVGAFSESGLSGTLVLPPNIKRIGSGAFSYNNITTVKIPSSVEVIEEKAFLKKNASDGNKASNTNLTKIINTTGKEFKWSKIINNDQNEEAFVTGTVSNNLGNVSITLN